jgi:hypothetical protein
MELVKKTTFFDFVANGSIHNSRQPPADMRYQPDRRRKLEQWNDSVLKITYTFNRGRNFPPYLLVAKLYSTFLDKIKHVIESVFSHQKSVPFGRLSAYLFIFQLTTRLVLVYKLLNAMEIAGGVEYLVGCVVFK